MESEYERLALELAEPFTIARRTTEVTEDVFVRVSDGQHTGVGAAAPSRHYGETADTVEAVLPELLGVIDDLASPHDLDRTRAEMDRVVRDNPAAKAAVDIALHDLAAKSVGLPLYRYLGLDPRETPVSSFTIGIDDLETMRRKTEDAVAAGNEVLKVKLGTDRDVAIVDTIREAAPEARLRVDANEAWTPREAVGTIEALADRDVEFVEQPVPAENREGMRYVHERAALPIAADESCVTLSDVPDVAEIADIANLKLMKCGGIREAVRMANAARAHGLEVMLGCMIESNAAIAAGVHLAPLLDYADLDGALLLAEGADPFAGPPVPSLSLGDVDRPGTGAHRPD
jgi:L-alanine-DL-glutamate epimerase-like enolase superfamily enzyme